MNHMEEVAHMLGLELYENFRIESVKTGLFPFDLRFTKKQLEVYDNEWKIWHCGSFETLCSLLNGEYEVIKIPRGLLTEQERDYLYSVIKPFRGKVQHISKLTGKNGEYICIDIRFDWEEDSILLPRFATGTLYKGMEIGKEYSVKDLGL